ncbi:hypothetical protein A3K42_01930 [candidate division WWE3 bacterium RBG_13_37_7]|uniref:Type-4 uracil-DNA glycosylase n=1 Tax=candidate division WWE3 bacterium RBG_13_37_7 TaxID=1802609 RepID=A0A1F4U1U6_UNCKA|nr:MAG: hypothetical protein A3K42_01930 [candidate division WWE3 bacterium RBG_13_37_7]
MEKIETMKQIEINIKNCAKCRLCKTAKNPVPGEGSINSEIVFIGEAPGATEDATGRPFVGRAGALLTALLKEIGLKREDVWIGNIIKHRPPDNRDPLPDEIAACEPYLTMQLKMINPFLVVTLGRFGMSHFYKDGKITRDHGHLVRVNGYNVYPIYHPAAALRNGDMLRTLKTDFLKIPQVLKDAKFGKPPVPVQLDIASGQLGLEL